MCKLQAQGTPGGAAAKEVARLSLHRVRDLQLQLSKAEARASASDKSSAQLIERLAGAEAKLADAHKEAAVRAAQAAELSAALATLEERAAAEEQGRRAASTQVTVSPVQWEASSDCSASMLVLAASTILRTVRRIMCISRFPAAHASTLLRQNLEEELAKAHAETAELAALQEAGAAAAEREAAARLAPLQAGGGLAVAVLLPFIQAAYFGTRLMLWLIKGMEKLDPAERAAAQ